MRRVIALVLLLGLALPGAVQAQVRAWLERDRIAAGETTTLNIETAGNATPDYAPLLAEFDLSSHSSRQQFEWTAGRAQVRSVYAVALRPRRTGVLRIPPLRVGAATTAALTLLVTPAAPPSAQAGRDVFVESEVDDRDPYVQQSVGWVIRAHAGVPLLTYELTQEAPPGATILQVGGDVQYRRTVGSRTYTVIERRYTLVPERAGTLTLPPARFEGQGLGGMFDRLFGDGRRPLSALSPPRLLQVRPIPGNAPQPWLPLHRLTLRYVLVPGDMQAGRASAVVVEAEADGVSAAQMPPVAFGDLPGVQVYAERPAFDESVVDGRPRVRLTRRFSIVPSRAGALRVPGPAVDWWDVRAGRSRRTVLPPIERTVAPGDPAAATAVDRGTGPADRIDPGAPTRLRPAWMAAALLVAVLAALGGAVAWRHRRGRRSPVASPDVSDVPDSRTGAATPEAGATGPSFARLLEMGDLAEIEGALRAAAPAGTADLDALAAALDDPAQRDALHALRRARWAGGDPLAAREALRRAFAAGIRWRAAPVHVAGPLPPLYPDR